MEIFYFFVLFLSFYSISSNGDLDKTKPQIESSLKVKRVPRKYDIYEYQNYYGPQIQSQKSPYGSQYGSQYPYYDNQYYNSRSNSYNFVNKPYQPPYTGDYYFTQTAGPYYYSKYFNNYNFNTGYRKPYTTYSKPNYNQNYNQNFGDFGNIGNSRKVNRYEAGRDLSLDHNYNQNHYSYMDNKKSTNYYKKDNNYWGKCSGPNYDYYGKSYLYDFNTWRYWYFIFYDC